MSHASASNSSERRHRHFVDQQVQGAMVRQAILYWVLATAVFAFVTFIFRIFPAWMSGKGPIGSQVWYHVSPFLLASAVLFPLVVHRAVKFSNRFVGPMHRFRRSLRQLARGEAPEQIELRKNDFWEDVAEDINAVSARFQQIGEHPRNTVTASRDEDRQAVVDAPSDDNHAPQLSAAGSER